MRKKTNNGVIQKHKKKESLRAYAAADRRELGELGQRVEERRRGRDQSFGHFRRALEPWPRIFGRE